MRTEKEKMLAGENYDATSPELWERWQLAKRLQSEYNNTPMTDTGRLSALLDLLLGSYGEHVWISAPFFVDYGENIHIGHHVEINMNCVFLDCNRITIGNYSGIGPGVHIYTVFHPTNPAERRNENAAFWNSSTASVVIGDDVWAETFTEQPAPLTAEEKKAYLSQVTGVCLGSDAFFPFGDNIERARRSGVTAIVQPGGSIRDQQVIDTCNKYGIAMAFCGLRLFHH